MGQTIKKLVCSTYCKYMSNSYKTEEQQKNLIKKTYGELASSGKMCCPSSCNKQGILSKCQIQAFIKDNISEDYSKEKGYVSSADLSVGCGIPTQYSHLKQNEVVLDLGCGAGNDCFLAREQVGQGGFVYGLDMTQEMLTKANQNLLNTKFKNIQFLQGEIENIPIEDQKIDVIISNCVINLVPSKKKAFSEVIRVLKPNGRICISDIVLSKELSPFLKDKAMLITGCVANAMVKEEYIQILKEMGFKNIEIVKEREIIIPDDIFSEILTKQEIEQFKESDTKIYSMTIIAYKSKGKDSIEKKDSIKSSGKKIKKSSNKKQNSHGKRKGN